MITGAVFIAMAWLDPMGPLAIFLGSVCCAVALESRLETDDVVPGALPRVLPTVPGEKSRRVA
jgi:hypothetical protein